MKCDTCSRSGVCPVEAVVRELRGQGRHDEADLLEGSSILSLLSMESLLPNFGLFGDRRDPFGQRFMSLPFGHRPSLLSALLPLMLGAGRSPFGLPFPGMNYDEDEGSDETLIFGPDGQISTRVHSVGWEPADSSFLSAEVLKQSALVASLKAALKTKQQRIAQLAENIAANEKKLEHQTVQLKHAIWRAFPQFRGQNEIELTCDGDVWSVRCNGQHCFNLTPEQGDLLGARQLLNSELIAAISRDLTEKQSLELEVRFDPELLETEEVIFDDLLTDDLENNNPELSAKIDDDTARALIDDQGGITFQVRRVVNETSDQLSPMMRELLPVLAKHDPKLAAKLPPALRATLGLSAPEAAGQITDESAAAKAETAADDDGTN